jgi:transcriptional regulator with GAF, ATPase, and Fis domain
MRTVPVEDPTEPAETFALEVIEGPDAGQRVVVASGLIIGTAPTAGFRLTDPTVSREHARMDVVPNGLEVVDLGSSNGTSLGGGRAERFTVRRGATFFVGRTRLRIEPAVVSPNVDAILGLETKSPAMKKLLRAVQLVARSENSVLLLGETGVGKSTLAKALHGASPRAGKPWVTVDCGALPAELVESTLFGHEAGAFTGATNSSLGLCRSAHGGTLFLDEVGELPLADQAKLLRVLETRSVRPVGGAQEHPADFRVVAATVQSLQAMVDAKRFRADLYFRLAGVELHVPPLRERREDISLLIDGWLKANGKDAWEISATLRRQLLAHEWPGNIRELSNTLERGLLIGFTGGAPQGEARSYQRIFRHAFQQGRRQCESSGSVGGSVSAPRARPHQTLRHQVVSLRSERVAAKALR